MSGKHPGTEDAGFTDPPPSYEESIQLMGHGPDSSHIPPPDYNSGQHYNTQCNPQYGQQPAYIYPPQHGLSSGVQYRQGPPGMGYILPPEQQAPVIYRQPQLQPNVIHIVQCPASEIRSEQAPTDHFTMAVMATIFCFCPTGVIAVLRAFESRSAAAGGNIAAAKRLSKEANKYVNISIIMGILLILLVVGVFVKNLIMGTSLEDHTHMYLYNTTSSFHDRMFTITTTTATSLP